MITAHFETVRYITVHYITVRYITVRYKTERYKTNVATKRYVVQKGTVTKWLFRTMWSRDRDVVLVGRTIKLGMP